MIYRLFLKGTKTQIAQLDADWSLPRRGEKLPIKIGGQEYIVTDVSSPEFHLGKPIIAVIVESYRPLK